jgi:hypothetical protein
MQLGLLVIRKASHLGDVLIAKEWEELEIRMRRIRDKNEKN